MNAARSYKEHVEEELNVLLAPYNIQVGPMGLSHAPSLSLLSTRVNGDGNDKAFFKKVLPSM